MGKNFIDSSNIMNKVFEFIEVKKYLIYQMKIIDNYTSFIIYTVIVFLKEI